MLDLPMRVGTFGKSRAVPVLHAWLRSPCVEVPGLATGIVPAVAIALATPIPIATRWTVWAAFEALVTALIRPLVVDPAAVCAGLLDD